MSNFKQDLNKVKAFVFDIDGVLTDAQVYCMGNGEQVRAMNTKDGFSIRYALDKGYPIGIISAGKFNNGAILRLKSLGITNIFNGKHDKRESLDIFCEKNNISNDEVLYMGDDIPDIAVLLQVGVPTCPADAVSDVKRVSSYISLYNGGKGCVRDVIEQTLRTQGKWVNIS